MSCRLLQQGKELISFTAFLQLINCKYLLVKPCFREFILFVGVSFLCKFFYKKNNDERRI